MRDQFLCRECSLADKVTDANQISLNSNAIVLRGNNQCENQQNDRSNQWGNQYNNEQDDNDEQFNPNVAYYKQKRNFQHANTLAQFSRNVADIQKAKMPFYRPIEIYDLHRTLFEAMIFPEQAKGIKFPAPFQIPTYTFQQKNSFTIQTNALGNALVQVNFGQFLDSNVFKTGISGTGIAGANALGYYNAATNQNGTSTYGNSNLFICNDATLTGTSQVSSVGTIMQAANVMQVNNGTFNAVRAGTFYKINF